MQCNHITTQFTNLSLIPNCTPPQEGDDYCVKCGEVLSEKVTLTCPQCSSERRRKKSNHFELYDDTNSDANLVNFCHKCGYDYNPLKVVL